jgi:hypothetical protein
MKRNGTIERTAAQIKLGQPRPRLLTIRKAAEFLGLTDWAMRSRIWAGDIPVVRFHGGRKMYIDVRDIEKFIERNKMTFA